MTHLPWRDVAPGDGPPVRTSVAADEAAALARLAGGRDVLEVGSAFGYSACVMALAGARHVTAVDPHAWLDSHAAMTRALGAYGVTSRVTIIRDAAGQVLPGLPPGSFGLAFIDGDHSYEAVLADVKNTMPLIRPGGWLACHDYGEDCCCPGVRQALDEMFPAGPDLRAGTLFAVQVPA